MNLSHCVSALLSIVIFLSVECFICIKNMPFKALYCLRMQWKKLMVRLNLLAAELNKPDLWNDPVHAGKISREHGSLMGKMKEVKAFEQELLEHIDMIKLAREENDTELELVGSHFFSRHVFILFFFFYHD